MATRRRKYIPRELRLQVWEKTDSHCWYCGIKLGAGDNSYPRIPHIDHVNPHHNGGEDSIDNLVLACQRCNGDKQGLGLEEYREKLAAHILGDFRERDYILEKIRTYYSLEVVQKVEAALYSADAACSHEGIRFYGERMSPSRMVDYQI